MSQNKAIYFLSNYLRRKIFWPILEIIWIIRGKPVPVPHSIKVKELVKISKERDIKIFVETGTYFGHTVDAVKKHFTKIYSIELNRQLAMNSKNIFNKEKKIKIIQGDSGEVLRSIFDEIDGPAIFWLDAHYSGGITARGSGDTPIMRELKEIFRHNIRDYVIYIDDAREFVGKSGYPSIEELKEFVKSKGKHVSFSVENDIIKMA